MKINIKSITTLLFIIAGLGIVQAQQTVSGTDLKAGTEEKTFGIHSANVFLGFFSPEMDYWNDSYLPSKGIDDSFGANMSLGADIEFQTPSNFRPRVGISHWSGSVDGDAGASIDELKIGFTRFNFGLLYAFEDLKVEEFYPYIGVEAQALFIQNKYGIGGENTSKNGEDVMFAPVVGIERAFGNVNIGVEARYNIGNYVQEESDEILMEHDVSVNGFECALKIGCKF